MAINNVSIQHNGGFLPGIYIFPIIAFVLTFLGPFISLLFFVFHNMVLFLGS